MQGKQILKLFLTHGLILQLVDIGLAIVNNFCRECVAQDFVVYICRTLRKGEERSLRNIVLEPEIVVAENSIILERVGIGDEVTG